MYYYGARYYDPKLGRFITADPIVLSDAGIKSAGGKDLKTFLSNPQNLNRYTYCLNNPVRYIDPDGLFIVLVHGVDKNKGGEWVGKFQNELIKQNVKQDIYVYKWGPANTLNFGIKTGGTAKDFIKFITELKGKYPESESVNIFAHSAGSVLVNKALRQGLKVDNVVIAGSPIISDYKYFIANTMSTHSFESRNDVVNFWISGWWNDVKGVFFHGYEGVRHNDWVMPWNIKNSTTGQSLLNEYVRILDHRPTDK